MKNATVTPFQLRRVGTLAERELFVAMAQQFYMGDKNYIRPLDKDINNTFDAEKNKVLANGAAVRFLLFNAEEQCVGRIAAFINTREASKQTQPTGGVGFFECIDNQIAANTLFDACKDWLAFHGMEAMDGPINLGERVRFWGLLVEGFDPPVYGLTYNPIYYKELFENYGFKNYHEQYCFGMTVEDPFIPAFYVRHQRLKEDSNFEARHMDKSKMDAFARDFCTVYNKAWASHGSGKQLLETAVIKEFKGLKQVMDERLNWFIYYKDEPIAFWVNLPEVNQIFKHFDGKFGLWQKMEFLFRRWRGECNMMYGVAFGVVPEFQGRGVESFMLIESEALVRNSGYKSIEIQWIHEMNPKMLRVIQLLGARKKRTLVTYRHLFDAQKPFERHPVI